MDPFTAFLISAGVKTAGSMFNYHAQKKAQKAQEQQAAMQKVASGLGSRQNAPAPAQGGSMVADGLQAIDPLIKMLGERRQAPPSTLEGDQAANAVNSISEILANLRQPSPRGSFP
tara:strand:+ start:522 stop:869 length:348 start_codon:yes stop_codon:yes gene_type:complete